MSQVWAQACEVLDIKRSMTSVYYPPADERTNQNVKQVLRVAFAEAKNWVLALDNVGMAINNAVLTAGGLSPYFLNLGYIPCLWPDVERDDTDINTLSEPLQSFVTRMSDTWTNVRDALTAVTEEGIGQANKYRQGCQFKLGDCVMIIQFPRTRGPQSHNHHILSPR